MYDSRLLRRVLSRGLHEGERKITSHLVLSINTSSNDKLSVTTWDTVVRIVVGIVFPLA